ncbi:MAG: hypothetical protein KAI47_04475 [Deltaproteobacteria bacterium]|nr:hypothetical protein [Deltaproteobacteria bacterium]
MTVSRPLLAVLATLMLSTFVGGACVSSPGVSEDIAGVIPSGKADDYLSSTSREYFLSGEMNLTLDAIWAEKEVDAKRDRAKTLAEYKAKAYGYYLNDYLVAKENEDANGTYDGFGALIKQTTLDTLIEQTDKDGMRWSVLWEIEMGAPHDLISKLPIETDAHGATSFKLKVPVLTAWQLEHSSYPRHFDPSTYKQDMEEIVVTIRPEKASSDAYPEYEELFKDGKLDVLILVGGDYNDSRYDLASTEKIFDWLRIAGYQHEARKYTDLTLDSPPFLRTINVAGKKVNIEITLYWGDIVPVDELDKLRTKIIDAYKTMDVVIYDGHAGQDPGYSGVVYHYNPRHAIPANDFAALSLPSKYQIYLFNGCKTYNTYPDAMYRNPVKTTKNLDIISTINFSWLSMQATTTSAFLVELLARKGGTHDPQTYMQILSRINKDANDNVYYGVHGLDDNPHGNPYADVASLCQPCTASAACPGGDNLCVGLSGGTVCAMECTANDGCPEGYTCAPVTQGGKVTGHQCLPKGYVCR